MLYAYSMSNIELAYGIKFCKIRVRNEGSGQIRITSCDEIMWSPSVIYYDDTPITTFLEFQTGGACYVFSVKQAMKASNNVNRIICGISEVVRNHFAVDDCAIKIVLRFRDLCIFQA